MHIKLIFTPLEESDHLESEREGERSGWGGAWIAKTTSPLVVVIGRTKKKRLHWHCLCYQGDLNIPKPYPQSPQMSLQRVQKNMNMDPQYLQDETDRPNIQLEVGLKAQKLISMVL